MTEPSETAGVDVTDLAGRLADIIDTSIRMLEEQYGHILASHRRKLVEAVGFTLGVKPQKVAPQKLDGNPRL
jgi:hypothetical protein